MANATCTNMLKVVALRGLRLDDDGTILAGATSLYVPPAPIVFGYTPVQPDRERFTVPGGDGTTCAEYIGPARAVETCNLRMDLCEHDAEWLEMLCGGTVITDATYGTIGYKPPEDSTLNENGVAIETWAIQWNRKQRALFKGSPGYYRHVFPLTSWQVGEVVQENAFAKIPLTGVSEANSQFGTGLAADPTPVTIGGVPFMWFLDDSKPEAECGYQVVS